MSRVFSEFERGIIVALKIEGSTWNQIKVELFTRYNRNISKRGMQRIFAKYLKTGEVKDQPRGGRPHKLSARSERVIKRISRLNNDISTLIIRLFDMKRVKLHTLHFNRV
jgi:transposase